MFCTTLIHQHHSRRTNTARHTSPVPDVPACAVLSCALNWTSSLHPTPNIKHESKRNGTAKRKPTTSHGTAKRSGQVKSDRRADGRPLLLCCSAAARSPLFFPFLASAAALPRSLSPCAFVLHPVPASCALVLLCGLACRTPSSSRSPKPSKSPLPLSRCGRPFLPIHIPTLHPPQQVPRHNKPPLRSDQKK